MSDDKLVAFPGATIAEGRVVDPEILRMCEDLVQQAREGRFKALTFVAIRTDGEDGYHGHHWQVGTGFALLGVVSAKQHELCEIVLKNEGEEEHNGR